MSASRSIVTGGAGFIGSHVTRALSERGEKVLVIDNLSSSTLTLIEDLIENGDVEFQKVDIRDKKGLDETIKGDEKIIYHLAADPRVKESVEDPIDSYEQNVTGTLNLLEQMRKKGIDSMVFASSGGTLYGDVETFPTSEKTPLIPISPYGASKAAAEMYLSAYAHSYSLKITSLRFANIYGPGSNHGVMYDFFHKLKKDPSKLQILGDGKQSKSYLYIEDCLDAIIMIGEWIINQSLGTYDFFNLGTKDWQSVTHLAEVMVEVMGLGDVKFEFTGGKRGWKGDVVKNLLDISKIQKLGWKPKTSFKQGIRNYVESLEN